MANKVAIEAQIQDALSNTTGVSTWAKLESYLITESDSILENVYSDIITETHLVNSITTPNSNFEYSVTIRKVGGFVHIHGTFEKVYVGSLTPHIVFAFNDTDFYGSGGGTAFAVGSVLGVGMSNQNMEAAGALNGEFFGFSVIYNTTD